MRHVLFVFLVGSTLVGCLKSHLTQVAAMDLDCPSARVDVESDNVAHASGCGRHLSYRRSCEVATLSGYGPSTVCKWVAGGASRYGESAEQGWDRQYRPVTRTQTSTPTTVAPSSPAPEDAPSQVTVADLGDLTKAEATLRQWVGGSVRLALANGSAFEGVLQYVRSYTLWFTDGTQHRLEEILAAERL